MSFEVNGPGWEPVIKKPSAMENNGGGGNLGYFGNSKKDKKEEKPKKGKNEADVFTKASDEDSSIEDFDDTEGGEVGLVSVKEFFKDILKHRESKREGDSVHDKNEQDENFFKKH